MHGGVVALITGSLFPLIMISGLIEACTHAKGRADGRKFPLIMISGLIEAARRDKAIGQVLEFPLIMISGLIEASPPRPCRAASRHFR